VPTAAIALRGRRAAAAQPRRRARAAAGGAQGVSREPPRAPAPAHRLLFARVALSRAGDFRFFGVGGWAPAREGNLHVK